MTIPALVDMKLKILEEPHMLPGAPQPDVFDLWHNPARSKLKLGRKVGNDIVLVDSSVSRFHLELEIREDGLLVCDMNSQNGTTLNGRSLAPMQSVLVRPGDKLRVGDVLLLLEATYENSPSNKEFDNLISQTSQGKFVNLTTSENNPFVEASADSGQLSFVAQQQGVFDYFGEQAKPSTVRDHSELFPPDAVLPRNQFGYKRAKPRAWLFMLLALLITVIIGAIVYVLAFVMNSGTGSTLANLPSHVFSSPANSDSALGVIVAHPSTWIRQDVDPSRVIFTKPDSSTAALTIEKPPSRTIPNANINPDEAIKLYITNIKTKAKNPKILLDTIETKLLDNTPAWIAKAVFSTVEDNVSVQDYTVTVLSFQCNGNLYFASVGEEARFYNGVAQQDLEASISSITCR
ncbi:MAG: FHA domain-containing protein [Chloroflexi bacterium]|uniref:FHA domain-containing protein n=1 Tax=Candidatus Chlorohelix allophototropha TaxID=3003348 RepID=A0A8T7M826_9CHLR|nr:FHA domain-containing protein [Chloroflexota bacterium]WJW68150.1 FHA domain-containing protein [Chloroflexota bacterium L227-S17]